MDRLKRGMAEMIVRWVCGECSSNNMTERTEVVTCPLCGKRRTSELMSAVDSSKVHIDPEILTCTTVEGYQKLRSAACPIDVREFLGKVISAAKELTFQERIDANTVRWCVLATNHAGVDFENLSFRAEFRDKKTGRILDRGVFSTEKWAHGTTHILSVLINIPVSIETVTVSVFPSSLEYCLMH